MVNLSVNPYKYKMQLIIGSTCCCKNTSLQNFLLVLQVFQQHAVGPCTPQNVVHCYVNLKVIPFYSIFFLVNYVTSMFRLMCQHDKLKVPF